MRKVRLEVEELEPRVLLSVPTPAHIVLVIEENHSFNEIIGSASAPYINSLASAGALMTNSFAVQHPSQPNYLDLFSGSNQGVNNDTCPHTFSTANLASELSAAGLSFGSFAENMPSVGYTGCTATGGYVRKHNPPVDFTNVPSTDDMPFVGYWPTNYATLPTVSLVVPDLAHDMHSGTVQAADSWLKNHLNGYVKWAQTNNSLLILTWDEDDKTQSNQIPTIFVGQMVNPGQYSELINHYNVLRTIEDMYGLPYAGNTGTVSPIMDIWVTPAGRSAAGTPHGSTHPSQTAIFELEALALENLPRDTPAIPGSVTTADRPAPGADLRLGSVAEGAVRQPLHRGPGHVASVSSNPVWLFFQNDDEMASALQW
jgi:acid phosphatase